MTYAEKLKDPRWQKKRLQIFERDKWQCTICKCEDKTLHVHHEVYQGDPWEAKNEELTTLCEDCHSLVETAKLVPSIEKMQQTKLELADKYKQSPRPAYKQAIAIIDSEILKFYGDAR
jgi:hypothetical protein